MIYLGKDSSSISISYRKSYDMNRACYWNAFFFKKKIIKYKISLNPPYLFPRVAKIWKIECLAKAWRPTVTWISQKWNCIHGEQVFSYYKGRRSILRFEKEGCENNSMKYVNIRLRPLVFSETATQGRTCCGWDMKRRMEIRRMYVAFPRHCS